MKIYRLNKLSDILSIRNDWNRLLEKQNRHTINQDFDYLCLLYKHYGDENKNTLFVVEDRGQVVGIFPFIEYMKKGARYLQFKTLGFIGTHNGIVDFCDYLILW